MIRRASRVREKSSTSTSYLPHASSPDLATQHRSAAVGEWRARLPDLHHDDSCHHRVDRLTKTHQQLKLRRRCVKRLPNCQTSRKSSITAAITIKSRQHHNLLPKGLGFPYTATRPQLPKPQASDPSFRYPIWIEPRERTGKQTRAHPAAGDHFSPSRNK